VIRSLSDRQRREWLILARTENVGPVAFEQLVDRFGSAAEALAALPELARRGGRAAGVRVPGAAAKRSARG
jgi:DNA processing protein